MKAVKHILRYLKGKPKLGLWYPTDSDLTFVAYTDSNFGGCKSTRKSTICGCQFLGGRIVSWQCKKQSCMSTSTSEVEYIDAGSCCSQCAEKKLIELHRVDTLDNLADLYTKDFDTARFEHLVELNGMKNPE
ncbi:uncharacterized mitochondrial protein AtMg00810-like [Helianthus annuus]|uniref:uncharacterized mitochondrial protein AtMg00810-like n=1 Tax=Helianthus annuus TaxID=4232 RepID=UPI000B8F2F4D|nr:uncharacterized mitochondrial protein AtMg00810-like [Helianthus annuus]